jgi:tetratricopeptide (TPR) repeat protein
MKSHLSILLVVCTSAWISAQSLQVQNMVTAIRTKDFVKGKAAADAAAVHESTKGTAKMWMYRGDVYRAIYSDTSATVRKIDGEAEEKALEAYINCLKIDAKENVYKAEVKGSLVVSAAATSNKANYYKVNKDYIKAIFCYDLMESALPFDFDQGMKRNNITKEKILNYKFDLYRVSGNKEKTKEFADKLIAINYKDPKLFNEMVSMSLSDKDTAAALAYIDKGKILFEDNMDLITSELNIYMARKKTDVLKDKLKAAIDVSPDNEIYHFVLANLYKNTNQFSEAEKEYLKAIELKSDYEPAIYNLGVLYYSAGKEWNDKSNALSMKDPKIKEYETKSNDYFKKAVSYLENSYSISPDKKTKQVLRQLCIRLGDSEKAEKYK